jgi:hypothetical protein
MTEMKTALAAIALTGMVMSPAAFASNEVSIKLSSGAGCWTYKGQPGLKAFVGEFHAGQRVFANAADDNFDPWDVSVEGPGGFVEVPNVFQGEIALEFVIPQSGQYSFSVGPNAIRGNHGHIVICVGPGADAQEFAVYETAFKRCLDEQARTLGTTSPAQLVYGSCRTEWSYFNDMCLKHNSAVECAGLANALALSATDKAGR